MKIYLVIGDQRKGSIHIICGIFSTRKKAFNYVNKNKDNSFEFNVREFELDKGA